MPGDDLLKVLLVKQEPVLLVSDQITPAVARVLSLREKAGETVSVFATQDSCFAVQTASGPVRAMADNVLLARELRHDVT